LAGPQRALCGCVRCWSARSWRCRHHPPPCLRPARGQGGEVPAPASKRGGCPAAAWLATRPRRSRYPSLAGFRLMRSSPTLSIGMSPQPRDRGPLSRPAGRRTRRAQAAEVWLGGRWQRCQGCIRPGRPCGPIASPSRPVPSGRGCVARGPHRDCSRPDRRGRPDQHSGGRVGAGAWGGAGRESADQPPSAIPGGWFWGWQRFPWQPAHRAARPTRQARWQRKQGPGGREGQTQQRQRQGQGQRQVGLPTAPGSAAVLAGWKRAAEHLDLGDGLGLVGLGMVQLGRGRVRAETRLCHAR
jgi:hypothetical protein